ncbi:MAG: NTP/NDP exchange transporter [Pseudomonadota bacterium]|jgi:AAA family ATP:ADP antiporter|nr:hypothetical protein [Alphaproteobacteria bacterium]
MHFPQKFFHFFIRLCRFSFGDFEEQEFKKFLCLGCIFALITGTYWALRSLKDSIFIQIVDKMHLPYAETVAVFSLFFAVIFYSKLLEKFSREKMLVLLPTFYGVSTLCFSVVLGIAETLPKEVISTSFFLKSLGYLWYVFVDSFGTLMVALFWAFAADTTDPISAKKGFPFIVAVGQLGGILFPFIASLPYYLHLQSDMLSMTILGVLCLCIVPFVKYFLRITPASLLASFGHKKYSKEQKITKPQLLDGLKLLLSKRYLLGIFSLIFIYEFLVTIFDFNFKIAAGTAYSGVSLSNYLSMYASSINAITMFFLLFGISNITRFLGLRVALTCMPVLLAVSLLGFLMLDSLSFLFVLMVISKSLNYALNGPALKQLYIPTTTQARFKAQAWIETFGSRASKEIGALFNMSLQPLQSIFGALVGKSYYLMLAGILGFPIVMGCLLVALYLGKRYDEAISSQKIIC